MFTSLFLGTNDVAMKTLLTLLLLISFSVTYAQSSTTQKAKRVISGERRDYDPNNPNDSRDIDIDRDRRTVYNDRDDRSSNKSRERINREYDAKVRSIENNRTLSRSEKDRIIRGLESERSRRLGERNGDYRNNRNNDRRYAERSAENRRYDDRRYNHKKGRKGNNGKHLGWQKVKGNPHRDR